MRKVALALLAGLMFSPAAIAQQPAWADKLFSGEITHDFGTVGAPHYGKPDPTLPYAPQVREAGAQ